VGVVLAVPSLAPPEEAGLTPAAATLPPKPAASDPQALALLRDAARTAIAASWTGTQIVAAFAGPGATTTAVVDIEHRAFEGSRMRAAATAGSPARELFEPDSDGLTGASPLAAPVALGADDARWQSLVSGNYQVRFAGTDTVAGERVRVVELRRADGSAAARLAVGQASGLPLQRQIFDGSGRLVRESVFTKAALVAERDVEHVRAPPGVGGTPEGSPLRPAESAALRSEGWSVPEALVPGLALVDGRRYTEAGATTLHLTYSDGLSAVSLFQQRGRLDPDGMSGWHVERRGNAAVLVQPGAPERLAWSDGGTVFTLVADVPDPAVDPAVAELPHRSDPGGFAHRFRRGIDRVGSWLDPTG